MRGYSQIKEHLAKTVEYIERLEGYTFTELIESEIENKDSILWSTQMLRHLLLKEKDPDEIFQNYKSSMQIQNSYDKMLPDSKIKGATLMTTEEAAKALHVNKATLANWRVYGNGPKYAKIGRSVLYPVREIDRFILSKIRNHTSEI